MTGRHHPPDGSAGGRSPAQDGGGGERNLLLRSLPGDEYERLRQWLEPVVVSARQSLWAADAPIRWVYFPRSCVISLMTTLRDAAPVEAATIGNEGLAGTPLLLGVRSTTTQAVVQVGGEAMRIDAERLLTLLGSNGGTLTVLGRRYAQALQEQIAQSTACIRRHDVGARCARWLLMTQDRVGASEFPLTHEFLAAMLGVRRASVTVAAGMLQQAGLIRYVRGRIRIADRAGLERASCECFFRVRDRYARLLQGTQELA